MEAIRVFLLEVLNLQEFVFYLESGDFRRYGLVVLRLEMVHFEFVFNSLHGALSSLLEESFPTLLFITIDLATSSLSSTAAATVPELGRADEVPGLADTILFGEDAVKVETEGCEEECAQHHHIKSSVEAIVVDKFSGVLMVQSNAVSFEIGPNDGCL